MPTHSLTPPEDLRRNAMRAELEAITEALPQLFMGTWEELLQQTLHDDSPLRVCVVGPFSVGKSSLINAMIERELLATALDESTALPTLLSFGRELRLSYHDGDSGVRVISPEEFQELSTRPTSSGEHVQVEVPCEWLRGYHLLDLPGLGGTDEARQSVVRGQIEAADVVLYMLEPRGPTRTDLRSLERAGQRGKRIKVLLAQWDVIQRAHERHGERLPDVERWSEEMREEVSGIKGPILPVSIDGAGLEELREFLSRVHEDAASLREARFVAQARPILLRAAAHLQRERETLLASSEEQLQALRRDYSGQRAELSELRAELHERRRDQLGQARASIDTLKQKALESIERAASPLQEALLDEPGEQRWEALLKGLNTSVTVSLDEAVRTIEEIHEEAVNLEGLDSIWEGLDFQFPRVEDLDPDDWYNAARVGRLEEDLEQLRVQLEGHAGRDDGDTSYDEFHEELLEQLRELSAARRELSQQAAPVIEHERPGTELGRSVGRLLGEVADVALIFTNPATASTTVKKLFGSGSKAKKAGEVAGKLVQGAQSLQRGTIGQMSDSALARGLGKVLGDLSFLEVFSIAYWGEQVGSLLDVEPVVESELDTEALARQGQQMRGYDERIAELQRSLDECMEKQLDQERSEYRRQLAERQRARLEAQLEEARVLRGREREAFEAHKAKVLGERVRDRAALAVTRARQRMVGQLNGLERELELSLRRYWDGRMEEALQKHRQEIDRLSALLAEAPTERARYVEPIEQRLSSLRAGLEALPHDTEEE